jgi:hypothetical protein
MTIPTMWPFKWYNGEQTPESVSLETSKPAKPLTQYERVLSDPDIEDSPF